MTTADPLAPFLWLNVSETEGGGTLGVIYSAAFLRGLDPAEVVRRFSRGDDPGVESGYEELDEKVYDFVEETDGGCGGGHVGVLQVGEWSVAVEPWGWTATDHELLGELSKGCEVVAVTRHDYAADHSFEYVVDGTVVTGYRLRRPFDRYGADPDRLNGFMRELGMWLEVPADEAAWDAAWEANWPNSVARAFALAAAVTGVPFTADLLDRPMLVGTIAEW
ncbi:DUF6461 domain-containing protein [Nonomuraea maritima]|uniref:DUF6461 domain-containing protein n=1 Tax=Nonomuraea maritima TaxID=683260 RepID=UPI00372267EB